MKDLFYMLLAGLFILFGYLWSSDETVTAGERFIVRRGGKMEISLKEGDPLDPIWIKAAGTSYFRFTSTDTSYHIFGVPTNDPLGYFRKEYFKLSEIANSEGTWKITDGKERIEVEIVTANEEQKVHVTYYKSAWEKFLIGFGLFLVFAIVFYFVGPPED